MSAKNSGNRRGELFADTDMFESEWFCHCCGCVEIGEFHFPSQKEGVEKLREELRGLKQENCGLVIATLIDAQKLPKKILVICGFHRFKRFKNPNSGNMVTMYMKTF